MVSWQVLVVGLVAWTALIVVLARSGIDVSLPRIGPPNREVLPAHYASLVNVDPARYPGYCPACETANEPGFAYCANCGAEIPTSDAAPPDEDVSHIVGK